MVLIKALVSLRKCCVPGDQLLRANALSLSPKTHMRQIRSLKDQKGGKWRVNNQNVAPVETPFGGVVLESAPVDSGSLVKPLFFTIAFSGASFAGAAVWEYEKLRGKAVHAFSHTRWFYDRGVKKMGKWRIEINRWWNGLSEGQRIFAPICFANVLVFLAWRIPSFQPTMVKYFCSNPAAKVTCWPMTLSTFSHYSVLHLFANMYVLHSFSTGAVNSLGREQLVGFYLASGVIASFASYVHKVAVNRPGLSLGASGAIMAVLSYACCKFPDLQLSIIFFPFVTFKAASAVKVIMALDAAGILLGWKLFDHAAHLGGAAFGMFWCYWGSQHIWYNREPVIEAWRQIRGPIK